MYNLVETQYNDGLEFSQPCLSSNGEVSSFTTLDWTIFGLHVQDVMVFCISQGNTILM